MQRGITLLEMLIALVVLAAVSAGVTRLVSVAVDDTEISVIAAHSRAVGDAANAYIKDNYSAVAAVATPAQPALIRVDDLVATGYLPAGFSAQNSRRQSVCVLVLEPTPFKLSALLVSEGGDEIDDLSLGQLAATIGGAGAGVYSTDPSVVRGAIGGFSFPVGAFANPNHMGLRCDGTGGTVAFEAGRPAMALWFSDGSGNDSTLYRDEVPGNPSLNTMNTPILFGASSVQAPGTACASNGAISRNADGNVLSCVSGSWRIAGSLYWGDPVASFAGLGVCDAASLGVTRVALTPTVGSGLRAYTCNGLGTWNALGVDDDGNFTVAGRAELAKLGGDLEIDSLAAIGDACSVEGRLARSIASYLLTCQSGTWQSATPSGGGVPSMYVIENSGLFTIPAEKCRYTVIGGGGGGSNQVEGAAGGGGGTAMGVLTDLTIGATINVVVGNGAGPTGTGGTSSIGSGTQVIPYIYATGGLGGNGNWTGYRGGYGVGGQLNMFGGPGESYGRQVGYPVGGNSFFGGGGGSGSAGYRYGGGGSRAQGGAKGVVVLEC